MSNLIQKIFSKSHRTDPIVPSRNNLRSMAVKIKIVYRCDEIKKVRKGETRIALFCSTFGKEKTKKNEKERKLIN